VLSSIILKSTYLVLAGSFPLYKPWHGPHRKHRLQLSLCFCVVIRYHGNLFIVPLPSKGCIFWVFCFSFHPTFHNIITLLSCFSNLQLIAAGQLVGLIWGGPLGPTGARVPAPAMGVPHINCDAVTRPRAAKAKRCGTRYATCR
jgi:hypothetical protein